MAASAKGNRADGSACRGRCGYDALRHRALALEFEGRDVFLGGFHAFREDGIGGIDEFHDSLRRRKGRVVERVGLGHDGNNRLEVLRIALFLGECVMNHLDVLGSFRDGIGFRDYNDHRYRFPHLRSLR